MKLFLVWIQQLLRKWLKPDLIVKSIFEINYDELMDRGLTNLFFDVDNTLTERSKSVPEWKVKKLLRELKERGFSVYLLSNSTKLKRMIKIVSFLECRMTLQSMKPLPFVYRKLRKETGASPANSVFIGDQLFTDILGARLNRFLAIYTYPSGQELSTLRRFYIATEKWILERALVS